jgi:hypothetical protein
MVALQAAAALPEKQQQVVFEAVIRVADMHLAASANSPIDIAPSVRSTLASSATIVSAIRQRALELLDQIPPPHEAIDVTVTVTVTSTLDDALSTPNGRNSTWTPTDAPPDNTVLPVVHPTNRSVHTPESLNTPPGKVKTPKPPNTPPGQVRTPKPANTPPGLVKTPKPKK